MTNPNRCRIEWTITGNRLKLGADADWSNPFVRVDVREDARLIAKVFGTVEIVSHAGELLDTVKVPR